MALAAFKVALIALLAANAIVYALSGTLSEALDAIAWFALLLLFEFELKFTAWMTRPAVSASVRLARGCAALFIAAAAAGYVLERAWLDAINTGLWIGVVALLELEVRRPDIVVAKRSVVFGLSALLYGGLCVVVLAWAWRGEWFDAYDALLWLVAFATIELGLLRREAAGPSRSAERPAEVGDKA